MNLPVMISTEICL